MVKFTNKAKGRPSKRKSLKVKFKIERKVKQHKKRVRKQAKGLQNKGLKHKGQARSDYLPNMFPFKQQMLEQAKRTLQTPTEPEIETLDQNIYGLIDIQNKAAYLPKARDNLIKKYITNLEQLLNNVKIVFELLEIRNPLAGIDQEFRTKCQEKNIHIISILTKADTLKGTNLKAAEQLALTKCLEIFKFTTDIKQKTNYLEEVITKVKSINGSGKILVVGKALSGKHTFLTTFIKHVGKYQENAYKLKLVKVTSNYSIIDTPYKLTDTTQYPLFTMPNPILQQSLIAQEERVIKRIFFTQDTNESLFKRDSVLVHFGIQDYTTITDLLSKIGKTWKIFGKGGSIDTSRVRQRILTEWYSGKLNILLFQ